MGCSLSTTTIVVSEGGPPKVAEAQVVEAEAVVPTPKADDNPPKAEKDVEPLEIPVPSNENQGNNQTNQIAEEIIAPEWTKSVSSLTWAASEKFAADQQGRLLTVEEAKSFLKKRGKALYPGEDQWAACIGKRGKDWIQVGDTRHPVGKSHVDEGSGYPTWGDDSSGNPPFSRSVMWFPTTSPKSFAASRKPQWKHGKNLTWHASKDEASREGGRLLELEEGREFLKHHGPICPGEDQWVAVERKDGRHGGRDWLQVGNKIHPVGKSHCDQCGGYPKWGDDVSGNPPFARTLLWMASEGESTAKPGPVWQKEGCSLTWDASKQIAARMGGRLLLLQEAQAFLKAGALSPGEDQWVAVIRRDGGKDWVQVGDKHHHVGKSHVELCGGYPNWGDDVSGNPPFNRTLLWISLGLVPLETKWVKPESTIWKRDTGEICEAMWVKPGRSLTWSDSNNFAEERAGRLLTLKEARAFIQKQGPLFVNEDQWAAVVGEDGSKDWIQVGNKVHQTGRSHVEDLGAYPSWGDDASKNPPHSQSVVWLAADIFSPGFIPGAVG